MSLLGNLFGHRRGPSFSRRKEWSKLKNNINDMKWRVPSREDIAANQKIEELDENYRLSIVGATYNKEIAGMIENKLRIFGLDSPKHFICHHYPIGEKDEYAFGFTESGIRTLGKKGIRLEGRAS